MDLSRALISISGATEKLTHQCLDVAADPDSFAAQHQALPISTAGSWRGSNAFRSLAEDLGLVIFAGANHLRTAAAALRSPALTLGPALDTLTRGALEAFARVHWILASESAEQMLWRHTCLAYHDLHHPSRIAPKERLQRQNGEKLDADAFRDEIQDWAKNAGLDSFPNVSESQLVANLVDSFDPTDPEFKIGRQVYSDLSGVAHSGWFSVLMFATPVYVDGRLDTVILTASRDTVIEHVAAMYLGVVRAAEAIAGYFNLPDQDAQRWNAAKKSARDAIQRVEEHSSLGDAG